MGVSIYVRRAIASLSLAVVCVGYVSAADHKHPEDKCPTGTHSVTVTKTTTTTGSANIGGSAKVVSGGASISRERTTTESHQVCRDNKLGGVKETGKRP
jgi:hypothetical protein